MGAGDAAPAEVEQQEEESNTVADFAPNPETAASGAPQNSRSRPASFHQRKITNRTSVRCNRLLSLLLPKATRQQQQRTLVDVDV